MSEHAQGTEAARLVFDMDYCEKGVAAQHAWNEFNQCRSCLGFAQDTDTQFARRLEKLLNAHSRENASNTPDFILAQYLLACLAAWNRGVQRRETWYGRDARSVMTNTASPHSSGSPDQTDTGTRQDRSLGAAGDPASR